MKTHFLLLFIVLNIYAITPEQEEIIDELKGEQRKQVDAIADEEQPSSTALIQQEPGQKSYASYFNKMMKVTKEKKKHNKHKRPIRVQSVYSKPIKRSMKQVGHVSDELNGNFFGRNGYNYEHTRKINKGNMRSYSKSSVMYYTSSPEDKKNFGQLPGFFKNKEGDMWF
ncbi:hypothetical protein EDI_137430 [Entamoeba dispar SAW760]|uniref:Uncharacterized protein n=1 Tax=Entamoeba dispar (strain ATCC PRA-260 / SAW760) TaxID=370354 RepID=B0EAA8_ENTDS|nr:uncharacterized protein EDI_137430 [Entamoeba dispar SAW760]EDR28534.1 hypothetical protein EDI_137430 [Entamoeba dispar SAW760]|eukprot:EDR28534.1 hypothetical protein EDI_137430 [Entamoeba dispar SAW760]